MAEHPYRTPAPTAERPLGRPARLGVVAVLALSGVAGVTPLAVALADPPSVTAAVGDRLLDYGILGAAVLVLGFAIVAMVRRYDAQVRIERDEKQAEIVRLRGIEADLHKQLHEQDKTHAKEQVENMRAAVKATEAAVEVSGRALSILRDPDKD